MYKCINHNFTFLNTCICMFNGGIVHVRCTDIGSIDSSEKVYIAMDLQCIHITSSIMNARMQVRKY